MRQMLRVNPGLLTREAAEAINQLMDDYERLARPRTAAPFGAYDGPGGRVQSLDYDELVRVKVTASGPAPGAPGGVGYSWVEERPDLLGQLVDKVPALSGTVGGLNPLYEINGATLAIGSKHWAWKGAFNPDTTVGQEYLCDVTGATGPVLVQISGKCYGNTLSGCPPDVVCTGGLFPIYSGFQVLDSGHVDYPPCAPDAGSCPIVYSKGPLYFATNCTPIYHARGLDLPVYAEPSPQVRTPRCATDDSSAGTVPWQNPSLAETPGGGYATSGPIPSGSTTHRLDLQFFCFSIPKIPSDATVTNVSVAVVCHGSGVVADFEVIPIVAGSISGTNHGANAALPATDTTRTYSDTPAGWGIAASPGTYNDERFGVALRYSGSGGGPNTAFVDSVTITITYTPAGGFQPLSVVRAWKGLGNYYVIHEHPWEDLFFRNGTTDSEGVVANFRYKDQNDGVYKNGIEVRLEDPA